MRFTPDNRLLGFMFALVALLAVPTMMSLAQDDAPIVKVAATVASATEEPRKPASVATASMKPDSALPKTEVFSLDCKRDDAALEVVSSQVRFRGKSCFKGDKFEKLEIFNETNGSTATIFRRGDDAFETDLIPLSEGANRLRIASVDSLGQRVERFFKVVSAAK